MNAEGLVLSDAFDEACWAKHGREVIQKRPIIKAAIQRAGKLIICMAFFEEKKRPSTFGG
jgi:hypothetical protein